MALFSALQKFITKDGQPVEGASVLVYLAGSNTPATLYATRDGGAKSNPFLTLANGNALCYAAPGRYDMLVTKDADQVTFSDMEVGPVSMVGTFAEGGVITDPDQLVEDAAGNKWRWDGALNYVFVPGEDPEAVVGWVKWVSGPGVDVAAFEQELAAVDSTKLVGGAEAGDIADIVSRQTIDVDNLIRFDTNIIIGSNPQPEAASTRDAFSVLRDLTGLTNCHGFKDFTVMSGVTDLGQYGVFDSVVRVEGSHTHDHVYSFQDRVDYAGTGALTNTAGLYSVFKHSGTGNVVTRVGAEIRNADITAGGTITNQFGVRVRALSGANFNTGVVLELADASGNLSIASSGTAKGLHVGQFGFGGLNTINVALTYKNQAIENSIVGFFDTSATAATVGVVGNFPVRFTINGGVRWSILDSSGAYAIQPGADNTSDIGTASNLLRRVYSRQTVHVPITAATAMNNSTFVDSADGKLKFKDGAGVVNLLY